MSLNAKKILLTLSLVAVFGFSLAVQAQEMKQNTAPAATAPQKAKKKTTKARAKGRKGGAMAMHGVPKGVSKCLDHLTEMANKDPLPDYEGHPSEVINDGLMWNDPKSNCSIGTDQALRSKVLDLANAWRAKDAARVRSLLQEIRSAAPQS